MGGFGFCDLLLSQGHYRNVMKRCTQTLNWATQVGLPPLYIALDKISLGRAYLLQSQADEQVSLTCARNYLSEAVKELREVGTQDYLNIGLLSQAALWRVTGALEKARRDLDEAFSIATRGGMRLHETDCHLEYARVYLACAEKGQAQESLAKAKQMIKETGYHRRDIEVKELEAQL